MTLRLARGGIISTRISFFRLPSALWTPVLAPLASSWIAVVAQDGVRTCDALVYFNGICLVSVI